MMSFITDELVWAIRRERDEEARNVRPHTPRRPDTSAADHESQPYDPEGLWIGRALRANASSAR